MASQNYYGNIKLTNQNQVDSFPLLYPNVNFIHGDLQISNTSNLDSLYNIHIIDGSLDVGGNFINFIGLDNLTSVGQIFTFYSSAIGVNCIGLNNLNYCSGFRPEGNDFSFVGLNNPNLNIEILQITGSNFENFSGISPSLEISVINIINCQFNDFEGLNNLDSLDVLSLQTGSTFNSYSGLNSLEHVGAFYIHETNNPFDFSGLENLISVNSIDFLFSISTSLFGLSNIDYTKLNSVIILGVSMCSMDWLCEYFNNNWNGSLYGAGNCMNVTTFLQSCNTFTYTGNGNWSTITNWSPFYPGYTMTNTTIINNGQLTIEDNEIIVCSNCIVSNNNIIILKGIFSLGN